MNINAVLASHKVAIQPVWLLALLRMPEGDAGILDLLSPYIMNASHAALMASEEFWIAVVSKRLESANLTELLLQRMQFLCEPLYLIPSGGQSTRVSICSEASSPAVQLLGNDVRTLILARLRYATISVSTNAGVFSNTGVLTIMTDGVVCANVPWHFAGVKHILSSDSWRLSGEMQDVYALILRLRNSTAK